MAEMLDVYHSYYNSEEYREALDAAYVDASHDGNPADRYPNLPLDEWDGRFIAGLLERGMGVRAINDPYIMGKPYPLMAPHPHSGGYVYPSYVVSLKAEHRSK